MDRPLASVCLCVRKGFEKHVRGTPRISGYDEIRNAQVLLHLRKGKHAPGTWAFSGGHLELYEDFATCALRELAEEAGKNLKVTDPVVWTVENTIFKDEGRHYVVVMMIADWISGEPEVVEPEKCDRWEWFGWDKLPSPLMQGIQNLVDKRLNPFYI